MSAAAKGIYIKGIYILTHFGLQAYLGDWGLSISYWNVFFSSFTYSELLSNFASLKLLRTYPVLPWCQEKWNTFSLWKIILLKILTFLLRKWMHRNRILNESELKVIFKITELVPPNFWNAIWPRKWRCCWFPFHPLHSHGFNFLFYDKNNVIPLYCLTEWLTETRKKPCLKLHCGNSYL